MANDTSANAAGAQEPAPKKPKIDELSASPLRPSATSETSVQALKAAYAAAEPYPHCVIEDLCDPALLTRVREELIENVQATYKETDLFNMFQTGDLANLDGLDTATAAKLPALRALRDALYSPSFRAAISEITGCGELSDRTDCACNVHAHGCHLLCHDDVIGTRAVSFIIYLTDNERPWTSEDGGALELYPEHPALKQQPAVFPTATVLPRWNTMAMFAVQPGVSFHSIQEVFAEDRPRMSIQGWYHRAVPPNNTERATLRMLQLAEGGVQGSFQAYPESVPTEAEMEGQPIPENDLEILTRYINAAYLDAEAWPKIFARFKEEGSVQLQEFLRPELASEIAAAVERADAEDGLDAGRPPKAYDVGVHDGWEAVGPAFKQRYLRYNPETTTDALDRAGPVLADVYANLFATPAFRRFLFKLTTLEVVGKRGEVRRFRPGLDYTVAHHGVLGVKPCLDAVLCVLGSRKGGEDSWESGEVGGYEAYLLADDDEESASTAEVYRSSPNDGEETGVLNICPAHNCLSLVLRDEETDLLKFVKYVSASAPGSRWDVSMEYQLDKDDEEEPDS